MNAPPGARVHATAIALAVDPDGPLAGVLLLGPSGAGKSSLALCAIEGCPFRRTALIADDQVLISAAGAATAPDRVRGLIEVRGLGPAPVRTAGGAVLAAAFDLGAASERVASPEWREIATGLLLPVYPFRWTGAESSAAHRLRVTVRQVLCGQIGEEPQDKSVEGA
ncbi:MAG: hypothetical protein U5J99_09710 [Parvularculaceae bacterium]|nr:hypothetical protein [Parvularculaceae bacterium]